MKQIELNDLVLVPAERKHNISAIFGGLTGFLIQDKMNANTVQAYADNLIEVQRKFLPIVNCDEAQVRLQTLQQLLNDLNTKSSLSAVQQRYQVSYGKVISTVQEYIANNCVDHLTGLPVNDASGNINPAAAALSSAGALNTPPPPASFITTYKVPLMIGGGVVALGLLIYAIKK